MELKLNRRGFLQGLVAAAGTTGLSPLRASHAFAVPTGAPKLRLGILSDTHVSTEESVAVLRKAFAWFRERDVDGVVIAGDITEFGLASELKATSEAWYHTFPNDKGRDGRKVEKLFVYGNHDCFGHLYYQRQTDKPFEDAVYDGAVFKNPAAAWKKWFKEDYAPLYVKDIKGYKFIGGHWVNYGGIPTAEKFIEEQAKTFESKRPFFYIQHEHPKDTVFGDAAWGRDEGFSTRALRKFPNAIALSGHSHYSLTDDRNFWQGDFTSIGTGSLRYLCLLDDRENSSASTKEIDWQMPQMKSDMSHHGMLMSVYEDQIRFVRHDFASDESLGADWVMPLPSADPSSRCGTYAARTEQSLAPEFAADATVTVTELKEGKNRRGETVEQVVVSFPAAIPRGSRVIEYEVEAYFQATGFRKTLALKRVYPNGIFQNESHVEAKSTCVFAKSELPKKLPIHFSVKPLNGWGKAGKEIAVCTIRSHG